jgi:hypothetical protein
VPSRQWLARLVRVLPRLGPGALAQNATHRAMLATGGYRRSTPVGPWAVLEPHVLAAARDVWPGSVPTAAALDPAGRAEALARAARFEAGEAWLFWDRWVQTPPGWTDLPGLRQGHWTDVGVRGDLRHDVRSQWEWARFDFVVHLARAWAYTRDERWAEAFWDRVECFAREVPPNEGIHWTCGQECALRLALLTFGLHVFGDAKATTPARRAGALGMVATLAARVLPTHRYGLSQRNTHALSEAAGLAIAAGTLPEHPAAGAWRDAARSTLLDQIPFQFAADGAYLPTSTNYMRMSLRLVQLGIVGARGAGIELPPSHLARMGAAADFLLQMTDARTGAGPNYGANDGTNLLSLSAAGFEDLRGAVQTLGWLADGTLRCPPGPWDEELLWMGAAQTTGVERGAPPAAPFAAETGGYYVLREGTSFGLIRCHSYTYRPSQADMLHLSVFRDGVALVRDGGSYLYFDDTGRFLKTTAAHNTVQIDGVDQMPSLGAFLYADWVEARTWAFGDGALPGSPGIYFDGEHHGYGKPGAAGVVHRRTVLLRDGRWRVTDVLTPGDGGHRATVHWHLGAADDWVLEGGAAVSASLDCRVEVRGPGTPELLVGEEHLPLTGRSPRYGRLEAGAVLRMEAPVQGETRMITEIGPAGRR